MHAEANRAGHGPRVRAKVRVKRIRENTKEIQRNQRLAQGQNKWAEHESGSEYIPFELCSRWSRRRKILSDCQWCMDS